MFGFEYFLIRSPGWPPHFILRTGRAIADPPGEGASGLAAVVSGGLNHWTTAAVRTAKFQGFFFAAIASLGNFGSAALCFVNAC